MNESTPATESDADSALDLLRLTERFADEILDSDWLRERMAQAWDEGHRGLCRRHGAAPFAACVNPYRVTSPAEQADR